MSRKKPGRIVVAAFAMIALVAIIACGGGGATPAPAAPAATATPSPTATPVPTSTPALTATPQPTATTATTARPTATPAPTSTSAPTATALPTEAPAATEAPDPTPEPTRAPTATTAPTSTPVPEVAATNITEFGFGLSLDEGTEVRTAGWTAAEPNDQQGILNFAAGGVTTILIWGPQDGRTALAFLASTYNILRGSQPSLTFDPISDGDIIVNEEQGVYGGFRTLDGAGETIGGGLIGTWVCSEQGTAFRLSLTGDDATVVQIRFDRLLDNFTCASS